MGIRLTDAIVKSLPAPKTGNRIHYDDRVAGFGVRVTAGGARSFILNYRTRSGRERRYTIGAYGDWKTTSARTEAAELKRRVDGGEDPLGETQAERDAYTVKDLVQRFEEVHFPKLRPGSVREYKGHIKNHISPALGHMKVSEVEFRHVDALHRKMTRSGAPIHANRVVATARAMFNLAVKLHWRTDNPARGVEGNNENKRARYLTGQEMVRLMAALAVHEDEEAANIIRLLLLTGARKGEVLSARWNQFDLANGVWTKPAATTKSKKDHRVPLSAPARQLLAELRLEAEAAAQKQRKVVSEFVFPSFGESGHRIEIKRDWLALCKAASLAGVRVHDLRHTFASLLASSGLSLPIIGALLGHTQPATTARYMHLLDDPLRAATETVGALISGKPAADVLPLRGAR